MSTGGKGTQDSIVSGSPTSLQHPANSLPTDSYSVRTDHLHSLHSSSCSSSSSNDCLPSGNGDDCGPFRRSIDSSVAHASGDEWSDCAASRLADDLDDPVATAMTQQTVEAAPVVTHDAAKLMLCGGVSGALAKTCTAPLARLTILYQVQALRPASLSPHSSNSSIRASNSATSIGMLPAFRQVIAREGFLSLWKGNMVTILHRVPYSAVNFATYEFTKTHLGPYVSSDVLKRLGAGGMSGLVACTAAYPLDLLRTRMAADLGSGAYTSISGSLQRIVRKEGARGLYTGLSATLLQVVPGLALNFTFYDTFKHALTPEGQTPTTTAALTCASGAGFAASTLTYPLDLVRRRMQVHGQGCGRKASLSYLSTWRHVYRNGGAKAFYAGIVPEYCKVLPGMAIAFTTYETLKKWTGATTTT